MPSQRPRRPQSGYAILAQAEEEEEEEEHPYSDNDDPFKDPPSLSTRQPEYEPIQPKRRDHMRLPPLDSPRHPRRRRANSTVDIKAINARLERWAEEIKERFTRRRIKGKSAEEETLEIHHSVFQAPDGIRPATKQSLESDDEDAGTMSKLEFDDLVESVRTAIELGLHPLLISQGSSGSYFAKNSGGTTVGVFKPKDEEPYANNNPKLIKWLHRTILPFAFGRACLIPNLSYVSEAAAYVLDTQLRTGLVPYTAVVSLSSKSFHYDYFHRKAYYRRKKPLPEKLGSFQVFLKGYKGATEFLREHPWPDASAASTVPTSHQRRTRRKRWDETCRPSSRHATEEVETDEEAELDETPGRNTPTQFWSPQLQQNFREQLEKLVILDYIMRNTDRGLDNWMIRIDQETGEASILRDVKAAKQTLSGEEEYSSRKENMTARPPTQTSTQSARIGAIDNSLSWPWKHPDAWRSFPFGWLFLPVSLIGRPFSENARKHFLPLLTSKDWWSETQIRLRKTFEIDADFQERMFARQIAVMKGQAWNVVETLKTPDHGPLELTRRARACVWDDLVDIPVATPLERPSEEMRRQAVEAQHQTSQRPTNLREEEDEEMDIATALNGHTTTKRPDALLGFSSPSSTREESENPFNQSRQNSSQDIHTANPNTSSPSSPTLLKEVSASAPRPSAWRNRAAGRMSYEAPRSLRFPGGGGGSSPTERRRRFSFAVTRGLGLKPSRWGEEDGEGDEGDLGYSAANDGRNATRKVIVERLELVKSRTPVFEWC
ncbi:phosphatidylinositol 3 and 4-kinase-domain-containing protein [Neohortaea acidophila]|uniref:Phosphatidylinositol 4-kinase n=1 Tax=Neohortaea acidophila TaxID=245834 RepID=A0A6A6PI72_9PEZI|nr:phosphatidylinositol 3 and 4-kinase-domain-containing protein [Neohortaea acidophila]KAF2479709.1 phosphatidylinositol 3 and 4-kinase-domain-containing protein [Neohortaea acidophila]